MPVFSLFGILQLKALNQGLDKNETWSEKEKTKPTHSQKEDFWTTLVRREWSPAQGMEQNAEWKWDVQWEWKWDKKKKTKRKEEEENNELLFKPIHCM